MNDIQVILKALQRERDDLHSQLMQVDRIIKRVKTGTYAEDNEQPKQLEQLPKKLVVSPVQAMNNTDNVKVQVLRVFDVVGKATKLRTIQDEFNKLTKGRQNIRDIVRALHGARLLRMVRQKNNQRGIMWIKADWLNNNQLKDEHKPDGFDLLYQPESLIYE